MSVQKQGALFGCGCLVGFLARDFMYWQVGLRTSTIHWVHNSSSTGQAWQMSMSAKTLRASSQASGGAPCPACPSCVSPECPACPACVCNFLPSSKPAAPPTPPPALPAAPPTTCAKWTALLKDLRWRFPSTVIGEDIPTDLRSFWDFAQQVMFGEGWAKMPGPHAYYSVKARHTLAKPGEYHLVSNGLMRPGTFNAFWMGQVIQKYPFDMWLFAEIFWDNKPDVIVECGTFNGAGAAFYSVVMQAFKPSTKILSLDIIGGQGDPAFFKKMNFPNLRYLRLPGGDLDPAAFKAIDELRAGGKSVMVFLDSNHEEAHVYNQLKAYSKIVTKGQYLIVEDTNVDMNPVCIKGTGAKCGGRYRGSYEALKRWLPTQSDFVEDPMWEQVFHITQQPHGWLKRVK